MSKDSIKILLIDDEPDGLPNQIKTELDDIENISSRVRHQIDLDDEDFSLYQLIAVDFSLDNWNGLDPRTNKLLPPDGLALCSVLQRRTNEQATGFVILTGNIRELAGQLPIPYAVHAIARERDIEWVLEKNDDRVASKLTSLARAIKSLPEKWEPETAKESLFDFLGIASMPELVRERLLDDALVCHPPIFKLSEHTHGLALVRWMLHRIIPYPCFLIDEWHLARRLGVKYEAISKLVAGLSGLGACKYSGSLHDFGPPLFWRGAVEQWLWEATNFNSGDRDEVRGLLGKHLNVDEFLGDWSYPVVVLNEKLEFVDIVPSEEAIEIQPDDWPPYADLAWTTRELANDCAEIKAMVVGDI